MFIKCLINCACFLSLFATQVTHPLQNSYNFVSLARLSRQKVSSLATLKVDKEFIQGKARS